jgi:porin
MRVPHPCLLVSALFLLPATTLAGEDDGRRTAAAWTTDAVADVSGGLRRGSLVMHNLDLTADWKADDWSAHGYVLTNFNGGFSDRYVGDVQTVSNIDTTPAVRLFEAWIRHTSRDGRTVATFGLINLNAIFDVQDVASLFHNSSHGIGPDYSQSGPSIFPISALGLVAEHRMGPLRLRAGVFDGVPGDANDDRRFAYIRVAKDEGAHLVAEAQYDFKGGRLKLGHWADTAPQPRLDGLGNAHRSGTYAQGQLAIDDTTEAWLRTGVADDATLPLSAYIGGGLVRSAPFGRSDDSVGLSVAHARFGASYRAAQTALFDDETTWEVTYHYAVTKGLTLEPDFQYVVNPGGDLSIPNAVVVGVRIHMDLFGS